MWRLKEAAHLFGSTKVSKFVLNGTFNLNPWERCSAFPVTFLVNRRSWELEDCIANIKYMAIPGVPESFAQRYTCSKRTQVFKPEVSQTWTLSRQYVGSEKISSLPFCEEGRTYQGKIGDWIFAVDGKDFHKALLCSGQWILMCVF